MAVTKEAKDLKQRMAVPPIPQKAPRDRRDRDRNRIRMEITPAQCVIFISILYERLHSLSKTDPEFKVLYNTYHSLKVQYDKLPGESK